jgi:hypothetical protein
MSITQSNGFFLNLEIPWDNFNNCFRGIFRSYDFLQYFDLLKALAGHLEIDNRPIFEPDFIFFVNEMKKGYVCRGCFDYVQDSCWAHINPNIL